MDYVGVGVAPTVDGGRGRTTDSNVAGSMPPSHQTVYQDHRSCRESAYSAQTEKLLRLPVDQVAVEIALQDRLETSRYRTVSLAVLWATTMK